MKYIAPFVNKLNLIIALFLLTLSTFGYAQEIIVDVNPDQLITASTSSYTIDMDNNGTIEFLFRVQEMSGDTLLGGQPSTYVGASAIIGALNGQPAGVNDNSIFTLTNFTEGEIVSVANEFGVDTSYSLGINLLIDAGIGIFPYLYGSFLGDNNAFLGVSFESDGNTHYGWIELSVSSGSDSIIVHSYGYNQSVEESVDVGGLGAIPTQVSNEINVWSNFETLFIEINSNLIGGLFKIISPDGKEYYSGKFSSIINELNHKDLPKGVYSLIIDSDNGPALRRFYIP
ncbi:MAG: hypothetical protein DBW72_01265 [Flavobacteriales bacterium]|nr:MAG: hypothetical protein DBW72_01265 [Flavobacteriales bacterium]